MKFSANLSLIAAAALLMSLNAPADAISGSVGPMPLTVNLSSGSAFAFYGVNGIADYQTVSGTATTDLTNSAHFSTLTAVGAGVSFSSASLGDVPIAVTYTGGASPQNTPQQNATSGSREFIFLQNCTNGAGISFTTTLVAATETITLYLENYDTASNFTAQLNGVTLFSSSQQVLPSQVAGGDGTGKGQTGGIVTLSVSGSVGETLTFSDIANYTGVSNSQYGNVGIVGAAVNAPVKPVANIDIGPMTWTQRSDWINVKSAPYNAAGNGTTDDTAAIQSALTAVQNGSASTAYFPAGTYKISSTLTLTNTGGVQMIGCGSSTTIKWAGASGGAMLRQSGCSSMRYTGFIWDGANLANCAYEHCSQQYYETEIRHENESFRNFTVPSTYTYLDNYGNPTTAPAPASGILSGFPTTSGGGLTGEMRVYNCRFYNCGTGVSAAWNVTNNFMWHMDSCEFDSCGVGFNGNSGYCYIVSDCHFQQSTTADIKGGGAIRVRHCTSVGSNAFVLNGCGAMVLQDCWVDGWASTESAVELPSNGLDTVFDCNFTNPPFNSLGPIHPIYGNYTASLIVSNNYVAGSTGGSGLINYDANPTAQPVSVPQGLLFSTLTSPAQTFLKTTWPADSTHIIDVTAAPYNADKTFVNDATSAIQSALTAAASANNGSVVYLPGGTYKISSTLNASTGKYSIQGAGSRSLLTWWGTSNNTVLKIATPKSMAVQFLEFYILENQTTDQNGGQSTYDSAAPTCDHSTITCIQETSTGSSSITYDSILDWQYIAQGPNPGPSSSNQDGPGLELTNLPAGSTVNMKEVPLPLTVQNCGPAQIFAKTGDGVISVSGTGAKTGFLGTLVAEGAQDNPALYDLTVADNQDLVVGDYYAEQGRNDLEMLRGGGTTTGRVTIEGFNSTAGENGGQGNGPTLSININNYAGRLFYGSQLFGDNTGQSPVQVTQTGSNPVDMILSQNIYADGLTLSTTAAANLIQTQDSAPTNQSPLTAANLLSFGLGFDHLRQLEAVDLSLNLALTTDAPPLAAYPMENNVLDTTTTYNGTNYGATFGPGAVGANAAQFNGTSSYIRVPRSISTNFSISMWLQTTDMGASGQWNVGKGLVDGSVSASASDFGTTLNAGNFSLGIGNPDTTLTSTIPVNDGAWHHVVATRNSSTGAMQVYVDGVLNNTATGPTGTRAAASYLRIGSIQTGVTGGFLNGAIDQVQIYNYVVSASDVTFLYNHTRPATQQMAAHWRLDEPSGPTSLDSSDHGVNGMWENGPTFSSSVPSAITFSDPGSLSFNGTNQDVTAVNSTSLPSGSSPRTLCGWAKSNGISGYGMFASYGTPNTGQGFWIGANGTSLSAGSWGNDLPDIPNFWDGNWHFIALTYDGQTASLYADGVLKESASKAWYLVPSVCYIGCYLNHQAFWNGNVDDVRIYNYALSPSQVANLSAGNP